MKHKIGFVILTIMMIAILLLRGIDFGIVTEPKNTQKSIIVTLFYITIAILIFIERKNLADFHIDRSSLIIFLLFSFVRTRFSVAGEMLQLIVIALSGVACGIILVLCWSKIPNTNWRWAMVGLFGGILVAGLVAILEISEGYLAKFENYIPQIPFWLILTNRIIYSVSIVTPYEEIVMRGFLWGYLRQAGLSENKACWIQGISFWLLHLYRANFLLVFFVGLPILTFLVSLLVRKSKQVFPSIIAHTITNALSDSILIYLRF